MSDSEWTKILGWPGYRVYRSEINEVAKTLRLWVRRKRGNRKLLERFRRTETIFPHYPPGSFPKVSTAQVTSGNLQFTYAYVLDST
ncbi:MAG: hypothetical protein LAO06_13170 [Acidobacteriia bacterium]|nr:hypothetical protein [Terriglobia bacterium]